MTRLWAIPLLGDGSSIEAFPGYFARLAAVHGVRAKQLNRALVDWFSDDPRMEAGKALRVMIGTGLSHRQRFFDELTRVSQTEWATGYEKLHRGSVAALRLSGRNVVITKTNPSWCPYCLREDIAKGMPAYLRLVWCIQYVDRCHLHAVKLFVKCPSCGRRPTNQAFRGETLRCRCRQDLTQIGAEHCSVPGYGEKDGIDLVEMISRGDYSYTGADTITVFISALEDNPVWAETIKGRAYWLTLIQKRMTRWFISYRLVLRLSYITGVSVADIFSDPLMAAKNAGQMFIDGNVMKSNHMLHPNEVILNFEGNLTCSLASDSPLPMTLKDYCVRHGVSVSLAKFRHPDLCASYMRQWKVESRGRISNQLRVARTACETLRLEWGDQRFFTDLAITAAHVASATGVSRAIVMRPLRVLATLRPYEGETFRSLVERLPLPVNDLRALIAVTRPICDKPAALVLPGDLVAPMSELEKEYTGRGISVLGIVVALKEAYQELGLTKYGRMTGKAGYGGWESILKTYRRTKRGEIRQDDVGVQIVKEYWSELLAFGPSVARLRFFISLGCPRMDIYDDILATGRLYRGPSRLAFQVKDGGETWTISVLDDELARVALSLGPPARKSTFWKAVVSTHRYALSAGVSPEDALGRNLGFYPFRKLVKGLLYDSLRKHRLPCVGLSLCMERMQQTDSEALRLAVEETLATWRALLAGE